jgi:DNA-binding CsgD family transcriptional regulator
MSGETMAAYANATEAVQLARDTSQRTVLAFAVATLARIEALLGREHECREHLTEAVVLARSSGIVASLAYASSVLGLLELGLGHPEEAIRALAPVAQRALAHGLEQPNVIPWQQDLIEAYIRCGRRADAVRELELLERRAERTGGMWSAAAALRCRGLLAPAARFDADFTQALALHATQPLPFERARTELCFGERLRRAGRRREAREPLRRALDTFERVAFPSWAALAHAELLATGERLARRQKRGESELTAQELQVARTVADGATNAEAASQLFISPKTVEKHLTSAYRKLGLRSRAQLAVAYASRPRVGM